MAVRAEETVSKVNWRMRHYELIFAIQSFTALRLHRSTVLLRL